MDIGMSHIFYYCILRTQASVHPKEPKMEVRKEQKRRESLEDRFGVWEESSFLVSIFTLGFLIMVRCILSSGCKAFRLWTCRHRVTACYNNCLSTSEILSFATGYHSNLLKYWKEKSPSWRNSSHQHYSTPIHLHWVLVPALGHGGQSTHRDHCSHCF